MNGTPAGERKLLEEKFSAAWWARNAKDKCKTLLDLTGLRVFRKNKFWAIPASCVIETHFSRPRLRAVGRKVMTSLDSILKSRDITMPTKVCLSQSYGFCISHEWVWELDNKKGWAPNNLCFQSIVLEKTLESPLDCKEIQTIHPKGNQLWIFIGRTDAEAEAPILWLPDAKSWLTHWKRPWC